MVLDYMPLRTKSDLTNATLSKANYHGCVHAPFGYKKFFFIYYYYHYS